MRTIQFFACFFAVLSQLPVGPALAAEGRGGSNVTMETPEEGPENGSESGAPRPAHAPKAKKRETTVELRADRGQNQFQGALREKRGVALRTSDDRSFVLYCDTEKNGGTKVVLELVEGGYQKTISRPAGGEFLQCRDTIDELHARVIGKGERILLTYGADTFRLVKYSGKKDF